MMHCGMDRRDQERVDAAGAARRWTQPRDRHRLAHELVVCQKLGKQDLSADGPMKVERVKQSESILLLHFELAVHERSVGIRRRAIAEGSQSATDTVHL